MGFPIATLVIGAGAAPILPQTMIVENLVMLPIGLTIAEMAGARGGSLPAVLAGIGLTLIRNPLLIAIAAGIAVAASGLSLPYVAARPVALLGTAAVPLALFVVGGRLAQLAEVGGAPGEVARIVRGQARGESAGVAGGARAHAGARSGVARGGGLLFAAAPMMSIYSIFGARFGGLATSLILPRLAEQVPPATNATDPRLWPQTVRIDAEHVAGVIDERLEEPPDWARSRGEREPPSQLRRRYPRRFHLRTARAARGG